MAPVAYPEKRRIAGEVVELLVAGDWQQLADRSTEEMRRLLTEKGASVWRTAVRGKGSYRGVEARLYTLEDASPFQADFTARFDRRSIRIRLALDENGLIAGLVIRPGDWH